MKTFHSARSQDDTGQWRGVWTRQGDWIYSTLDPERIRCLSKIHEGQAQYRGDGGGHSGS